MQGRHAGLQREQILRAAIAFIDRESAAALSMRRLARDLGVEAMTLYHHIGSKDALEDAIVEQVLADAIRDARPFGSWKEALDGYTRDLHRALVEHPGAVPLFATRPAMTTRNLRVLERLLDILCDAGFTPTNALQIVHTTAVAVIGQHATVRSDVLDHLDAVDAEFPLTREAASSGWPDLDARVDFTLNALTTGFEARITDAC